MPIYKAEFGIAGWDEYFDYLILIIYFIYFLLLQLSSSSPSPHVVVLSCHGAFNWYQWLIRLLSTYWDSFVPKYLSIYVPFMSVLAYATASINAGYESLNSIHNTLFLFSSSSSSPYILSWIFFLSRWRRNNLPRIFFFIMRTKSYSRVVVATAVCSLLSYASHIQNTFHHKTPLDILGHLSTKS